MYIKYTDFKDYKLESSEGKKAVLTDALFDYQGFKITNILAVGGQFFHRSDFMVPVEIIEVQDAAKSLKAHAAFSRYKIVDAPGARAWKPLPSGPIPGIMYADWSHRADSYFAKEIEAVIEHHKRYSANEIDLLSVMKVLEFSLETIDTNLGQVNNVVFDTDKWIVPYFVIDRSDRDEQFLCPNFLVHDIDFTNKKFTTCLGPLAFENAPKFDGNLASIDEDKIWGHYLRFYPKETRKAPYERRDAEGSAVF